MDKATTGASVLTGTLVASGLAVVGFGVSHTVAETRTDPDGFYVVGGWIVFAGVLVFFFWFLFWPLMERADRLRWWIRGSPAASSAEEPEVPKLSIVGAWYGDHHGVGVDVTEIVQGKVTDDQLSMRASHRDMAIADPSPNKTKHLKIEWVYDGKKDERGWPEDEKLGLPLPQE